MSAERNGPHGSRSRVAGEAAAPPAAIPSRRRFLGGCLAASGLSTLSACGGTGLVSGATSRAGTAGVGRAALLLPLTGQAAGLGQILREAASLGGVGVGQSAEVEILDSGSDAESATAAAKAAVESGAQMIVGPLFSAQARPVAQAAPRIPVVTLSNDSALAGGNLYVFGLTPDQSARAVLQIAARRGKRRVAMVAPPGPYATRAAAAFRAIAPALELTVTQVLERAEPAGLREALVQDGALPDAVYLPQAGPELAGLAGALAGSGVQILGSAQWSGIDPLSVPALRGAWFAAPDPLRFRPFALALADRIESDAGILAGLTFDGAEMARLLGRVGTQNRAGLLRKAGFDGVMGPFRFTQDNLCRRGLAVLEVGDGALSKIAALGA